MFGTACSGGIALTTQSSFFGTQEGDFSLSMRSIAALPEVPSLGGAARSIDLEKGIVETNTASSQPYRVGTGGTLTHVSVDTVEKIEGEFKLLTDVLVSDPRSQKDRLPRGRNIGLGHVVPPLWGPFGLLSLIRCSEWTFDLAPSKRGFVVIKQDLPREMMVRLHSCLDYSSNTPARTRANESVTLPSPNKTYIVSSQGRIRSRRRLDPTWQSIHRNVTMTAYIHRGLNCDTARMLRLATDPATLTTTSFVFTCLQH